MKRSDVRAWMWSDAIQTLARAERLQRQLFQPMAGGQMRSPSWEPPVDVFESDDELRVLAALPGVDPEQIQVVIDQGVLIIAGERKLRPALQDVVIHRLELPQGRFERRLGLPPGRYDVRPPAMENGCLVIILRKIA
ncbi:MAG: Hsp20/alpha crystallin family protein [Pigmentiphaga sp.]|nr:Hsp20/alpha crystallin family protein [Pigmentiphaga sp.]